MAFRPIPKNLEKLLLFISALFLFCSLSFGQNPIITENALPGTPQSIWDAGDNAPIEGFAQEFSVNKGETVHFKIDVESATLLPYTVKIYRLGWYQGNGARLVEDLGNSLTGKLQPAYNYEVSTGKVDCNNWAISTEWTVPATAVSGVYMARLDCPSLNAKSLILFIVRDDVGNAPILFKTSDATWQAYNNYGGNTFYLAATPVPGFTHATKVSYQRPLHLRGDKSNFFSDEYPMLRWIERNGYNVSYSTDLDMARNASAITTANHKILLSVGHDEYWSNEQRSKFETARANGVHIAFMSGNEVYWKTRWEDSYQTLVCYKEGTMGENICGTKCDPMVGVWTGLWRDGCSPAYGANDGCRPEGPLSGQMSWTQSTGSIKVPDTYKNLRFWKNTSIASLGAGQTSTLPYGTLGNEWDPEQFTQTYPAHRIVLSNTQQAGFTHKMAMYKYSSGALVFGAGTMQWSWGLDDSHDLNTATPPIQPVSTDMQQATANLFHDMGVDAGTLQADLVTPTIGADVLAPSSTISSPIHNSNVAGASVTITGTSIDNGTGAIAGVEISLDNGATWKTATGLENWSYTFSPAGFATITIRVRAWDDLGNVEVPGSPGTANCINITLSGPFIYSVFNSTYPVNPPIFSTGNPVELGMKFRSSVSGNVTGFRYYKGTGTTGVHTGHLWSSNGTLLAAATFTNETASGWQTVALSTPVPIAINTTYVVSYFSASGDFIKEDPFFTQAVVNGFLRGLANGEDGGNGVYMYAATPSFPNNTFGSSNYYADIIFESGDAIAPTVQSVTPANNSTGILLNVHPTATLDEALNPASVTRSTVIMTGPGNVAVSGTVLLTGGSLITFTPNAELAVNSTYTVTLKGGLTEPTIKDLIGNPLATNYSWSFTTGQLSMPAVVTKPTSQSVCVNSPVSFTSKAIGIPTPTVQWQKSLDNGFTWNDIIGATSGTYGFTAVYSDNNNQYRAVWTNSQGHDNSIPALLTVGEPVSGSIAAVNAVVCPGATMQLQLTAATGPSPYSLQINSTTYTGITVGQPFTAVANSETIWPASTVPADATIPDNNSLELGVRFQANKDGQIKGIRFYKGSAANGGTHIGNLWTSTGTLLASATFQNESASGWQQVLFATPVNITAGTSYVASYFLPQGNYSRNGSYFITSHSNGNSLTALADDDAGGASNGLYSYNGSSTFPANNFGDPNYWIDVVFAAFIPTVTTTFNLTSITAANGCSLTGNPLSSATITVAGTVSAGAVSGLANLCIGATTTYTSNGTAGGAWSSTNTSVATVDPQTGAVTALGAGVSDITYTITGCNGTFSAIQSLTVAANANAGTLFFGASTLCIGGTTTYSSNGDAGGSWSSSDPAVATIGATGFVTALTAGTTNITYTVSTGCSSPVSALSALTVNPNASAGLVSGTSSLCVGTTTTYTSNGDAGGTWSISNPVVASVSASGLVTALSPGSTDITYTITTGCASPVSNSKPLTVTGNVDAGTVSGNPSLCIGATATYTSNGDAGGVWSSSNPAIASVNANGLVTALTAGTTNIIYTVSGLCVGQSSAFQSMTVNANVTAGTVTGASSLCVGSTATYTSDGYAGGVWSSSNPSVASVNVSGLVTALIPGSTDITYTIITGCASPASNSKQLTVTGYIDAGTVSGNPSLCIGATATYSSSGTAGGTWSSSNPATASVNVNGLVTALAAGTTNIIYTVSGICVSQASASQSLTVSANVTAGIVTGISPLCIGATATYTSNGTPGGSWSSSNPSVATVSAAGVVTAATAGATNITYTVSSGCGSPVSSFKVLTVGSNINAGTVAGTSPLCIGATATYSSSGTAGGTWNSSNPLVASVNAAGSVTALSAGTTNITYSVGAGCGSPVSSFKILTVSPNVSAGTVTGTSPLCINATTTYTSNGTAGGTWSSSNSLVASVNAGGLVTALAAGTTNITYTVTTGCGSPVSASGALSVTANVIAGTVSGSSPLCAGTTSTYTSNGTAGGTWSSSNTVVATINAAGLVTTLTAGTTNITYTVSAGCGGPVSSFKTLTVNANSVAGVVSGVSALCIGATTTYTSSGTAGGSWSSSNPAVATVNAAGLVTALTTGTTNITYTLSGGCGGTLSSFKTLTVSASATAGTVSGTSPLCTGATATYSSNGTGGGSWSSNNTAVATVSAAGLVTAISAGTATITYTVTNGCGGPLSSAKVLTVAANNTAGTVSGVSPMCIGATATYSSNGTAGGSWSSSNTSVATINAAGLVTALSQGSTAITYTVTGGCNGTVSSSKTLAVGVNFNPGTVSGNSPLCINATATYTSNGTAGGTWSSSNTTVATITAAGLVKAVAAGTTNIKYTISTSCGTVSSYRTLTVSPNANAGTISGTTPYCSLQMTQFTSNGDPGGTWSSSNPWVAYVTPNGYAIALFFGTANVIYTVNTGCNAPVSAYKPVTISLFPYAGIVSGNASVCRGASTPYTSNGSTGGTWSSSNTTVATVSSTGIVTGVNAGTAVIYYSVRACTGYASASKTITVNPITTANAGVITGPSTLCVTSTSTFSSNGNTGGTWNSSSPSVATINATTGFVTPVSVGTTNISYKVSPTCGTAVTAVKLLRTITCNTFANTGNANSAKDNAGQADESGKQAKQGNVLIEPKLEAYPNPSNDEFIVQLKGYSSEKISIIVTDLLGKKVHQADCKGQQQYRFGKNLTAGIYLMKVIQGNSIHTIKLIKE